MAEQSTLKPEELQEIISWISVDGYKTADEFKTNFQKKYLTGEDVLKSKPVKDHIGKLIGSINTDLKQAFKTLAIDLPDAEIEEDDGSGNKRVAPKKIALVGAAKLQELNNKIQEELKGQIGKSTDERLVKLQDTFNKLNTDFEKANLLNKELKGSVEERENKILEVTKNADSKIKDYVKQDKIKGLFSSFAWADEADEFIKEGFVSKVNKKAKFELDEKDNLIVRNSETGEKFANGTANGVFLTPDEFLKSEGIEANKIAKVYKINSSGNEQKTTGEWFKRPAQKNGTTNEGKAPLAANVGDMPSTAK